MFTARFWARRTGRFPQLVDPRSSVNGLLLTGSPRFREVSLEGDAAVAGSSSSLRPLTPKPTGRSQLRPLREEPRWKVPVYRESRANHERPRLVFRERSPNPHGPRSCLKPTLRLHRRDSHCGCQPPPSARYTCTMDNSSLSSAWVTPSSAENIRVSLSNSSK